jgi:hypothetical protein
LLRSHANLALKEAKKRGKNQVWLYAGHATNGDATSATAQDGAAKHERRGGDSGAAGAN